MILEAWWILQAGLSAVTFMAYGMDKRAARRGTWRTSERTLHLLSLAGGWPGALVAQMLLRHKSRKPAFRLMYWFTVAANVAVIAGGVVAARLWFSPA